MKVLSKVGDENIAMVYIAELGAAKLIEFVESLERPIPREKKWVLIVSMLAGCPVACRMCDAGGNYQGKLTAGEIFEQIFRLRLSYGIW